jgi:hypothetical protein
MKYLPFRRDLPHSDAASSLSFHASFPQQTLYTVPEHELDNSASLSTYHQPSSTLCVPKNDHQGHSLNRENHSQSWTSSRTHPSTPRFTDETQTSIKQGTQRRACGWTVPPRIALHIINLAASATIIGLLAQALLSHRKLRRIRQFNGSDSAWPKQMSLTPSIILLSVASTGVFKSAVCLMAEVCCRKRLQSLSFLGMLTASSAVMGAMWLSITVFVEMKRQNHDDFATWACARSDAAVNQIVPYKAICEEEVRYYLHPELSQSLTQVTDGRNQAWSSDSHYRDDNGYKFRCAGSFGKVSSSKSMKGASMIEIYSIDANASTVVATRNAWSYFK